MGMQEKSGSYESFHAHNDIATVAIFAPKGAQRVLATRNSPRTSERVSLPAPDSIIPRLAEKLC